MIPVIEENGVKKFIGQEDPSNPPVFVKNPSKRYCPKCHKESDNDKAECPLCFSMFDDGKMQCPVCNKFFEFLLGDDTAGGRRGCEVDWRPAIK